MKHQTAHPILELQQVSFRYPDHSLGLDSCSFSIPRGSRTALLGANGAGKTTLFLHLNGILRPLAGTVLYGNRPLNYSRKGLHDLRSRIGLVFQNPDNQLFSASVLEDVSFGPLNLGLQPELVRARVAESLRTVGMMEYADKPVHNLSYGQKKRICIAGVLAMQPEILILDEPMAGLDFAMQQELTHVLDRLHAEGMTIIIATHDIDFAHEWADSISIMVKGKCVATWAAEMISEVLEELAGYALGIPRVAQLHQALIRAGIVDGSAPASRNHQALLQHVMALQPVRAH